MASRGGSLWLQCLQQRGAALCASQSLGFIPAAIAVLQPPCHRDPGHGLPAVLPSPGTPTVLMSPS